MNGVTCSRLWILRQIDGITIETSDDGGNTVLDGTGSGEAETVRIQSGRLVAWDHGH